MVLEGKNDFYKRLSVSTSDIRDKFDVDTKKLNQLLGGNKESYSKEEIKQCIKKKDWSFL